MGTKLYHLKMEWKKNWWKNIFHRRIARWVHLVPSIGLTTNIFSTRIVHYFVRKGETREKKKKKETIYYFPLHPTETWILAWCFNFSLYPSFFLPSFAVFFFDCPGDSVHFYHLRSSGNFSLYSYTKYFKCRYFLRQVTSRQWKASFFPSSSFSSIWVDLLHTSTSGV